MPEQFVKFANSHGLSGHAYTMALWAFEAGHAAGMERAAEIAANRAKFADVEGADELSAVAQDIRADKGG